MNDPATVSQLTELIAALDRRLPHVERDGEADIARDAARLRLKAVARLTELQRAARAATATTELAS